MIILIASAFCAGILYRLGGKEETKIRDFGVPAIATLYLFLAQHPAGILALVLHFGLLFGALTTYHKWLNKAVGAQDNAVHWYSWLLTGFCYGLAALPLITSVRGVVLVFVRAVILGVLTMLVSEFFSDVNWEEGSRGFLIIITMPILFI